MNATHFQSAQPQQRPNAKLQALADLQALREASEALTDIYDHFAPRMLVLAGIPGSGKTTFSKMLVDAGWGVRVSQDDSGGSRHAVERQVVEALKKGDNVIVDRCNFDRGQRKHWVEYASARGCHVGVAVFATSFQECLKRVKTRTSHPTLQGGSEDCDQIVLRMANSFEFPTRDEGFSFCRVIRTDEDIVRVLTEITEAQ